MTVKFIADYFLSHFPVRYVSIVGAATTNSKGILGDFSLICELNCYQTISSPICL